MDRNTLKDIRKMSFAVGFGLTMGIIAGSFVGGVSMKHIGKVCDIYLKSEAEKGNKTAQDYCDKYGIKHTIPEED